MNYLNKNDEQIGTALNYGVNFDVLRKEVNLKNERCVIYVINSLLDGETMNDFIASLVEIDEYSNIPYYSANASVQEEQDIEKAIHNLFAGVALVISEFENKSFYLVDTRHYPTRGVSEPSTEKTVRGSKDGFVENIITNVGLVRRRIRDTNLIVKIYEIGDKTITHVVLMYLKNSRFIDVAKQLEEQLANIQVNELVMSDRALEESLFKQKYNPFPLVRYSERPDVVAINLIQGYAALLVDTSPSAILTPTTLFEHIEHVEEYRQTPIVGTFTRFFRLIAVLISVFLVPLWMVVVTETDFSGVFLIRPEGDLTVNLMVQVLIVEVMIEVLRIATIHTPTQLSSAMGLVAALLLGQMAVDIGVFIPEVLLYGALSALGGFATPSYELSLANKITKIVLIILVGLFHKVGFLLGMFALFMYLVSIKVFGVPYLYPLVPFDFKKFINLFFRSSSNKTKKTV
jgi:stage V sporulation protein AF